MISYFYNISISRDVAENLYWGYQWQLGYYKHPPFFAWLNQLWVLLFNNNPDSSYFINPFLFLFTAFFAAKITKIAIPNATFKHISLAVLITSSCLYYNILGVKFNANTILTPIWCGIIFFYLRIIKNDVLIDHFLFAFLAAIGLYSKYYTALLLLTLLVITLTHPLSRKRLTTLKLYCTLLLISLLYSPHIYWLIKNNFISISYALTKTDQHNTNFMKQHILGPAKFLAMQIGVLLPSLLIGYTIFGRKIRFFPPRINSSNFSSFLSIFWRLFFIILLSTNLLLAIICGIRLGSFWSTPFWGSVGVYLLYCNKDSLDVITFKKPLFASFILIATMSSLFAIGLYKSKANRKDMMTPQNIAREFDAMNRKNIKYLAITNYNKFHQLAIATAYIKPRNLSVIPEANLSYAPNLDPKAVQKSEVALLIGIDKTTPDNQILQTLEDAKSHIWPKIPTICNNKLLEDSEQMVLISLCKIYPHAKVIEMKA